MSNKTRRPYNNNSTKNIKRTHEHVGNNKPKLHFHYLVPTTLQYKNLPILQISKEKY